MGYEPIANGLVGTQYMKGVSPPLFNRWEFDPETFRVRQEVEREEVYGADGDVAADSFSRPKVIFSGELRMKYIEGDPMDPPNIGQYAQIAGGSDLWKTGATYFWVLVTASEVSAVGSSGKVLRCAVEMEYRPAAHDGIEDTWTGVANADVVPS